MGTHEAWKYCLTRRAFTRAVLVGALSPALLAGGENSPNSRRPDKSATVGGKEKGLGIPGPFPGRVVEVYHPGSVVNQRVQREPVRKMVDRGMRELAGVPDATDAWRLFFEPGDVVGVKVNPVGAPRAISSHELVHEVVAGLKSAGVKPADIIVFDRYRRQFRRAGYVKNLPDGVRWDAAVDDYDTVQLAIEGYDPDVYREMDLVSVGHHDPKDDRTRRSHLCLVVSRKVNKIVNLPVVKDHASAGVTLALKNMSHGFVNNVARSHATPTTNACNTFIPAICSMPEIRSKVVLHILDGTKAVFEGGPGAAMNATWSHKTLYFATDPVALDRIGWDVVDAKRVEKEMPVVAQTHFRQPTDKDGYRIHSYRQPQHIELASALGLGVFDREVIEHRRIALKG
ncbi:DUF362 domain-containing protein [Candidatus Thiosymbion oneisti]|uniref:DUF362 domain-containing protein n=1 Tax=Candidatus Thiosymbion oneisti TaxID=589554 RepID=UPI00105D5404|nr:DUF362 domain-containing protein [Candidatus Thiosymbion oneisti]